MILLYVCLETVAAFFRISHCISLIYPKYGLYYIIHMVLWSDHTPEYISKNYITNRYPKEL